MSASSLQYFSILCSFVLSTSCTIDQLVTKDVKRWVTTAHWHFFVCFLCVWIEAGSFHLIYFILHLPHRNCLYYRPVACYHSTFRKGYNGNSFPSPKWIEENGIDRNIIVNSICLPWWDDVYRPAECQHLQANGMDLNLYPIIQILEAMSEM